MSSLFTRAVLINAIASEACIKANYGILFCTTHHIMYVMITYNTYIISIYYTSFPPFVDITLLRESDVVIILCYTSNKHSKVIQILLCYAGATDGGFH
jgi:hypothetical protein